MFWGVFFCLFVLFSCECFFPAQNICILMPHSPWNNTPKVWHSFAISHVNTNNILYSTLLSFLTPHPTICSIQVKQIEWLVLDKQESLKPERKMWMNMWSLFLAPLLRSRVDLFNSQSQVQGGCLFHQQNKFKPIYIPIFLHIKLMYIAQLSYTQKSLYLWIIPIPSNYVQLIEIIKEWIRSTWTLSVGLHVHRFHQGLGCP